MEITTVFSAQVHRVSTIGLLIGVTISNRLILILIQESVFTRVIQELLVSSFTQTINEFVLHGNGKLVIQIGVDEELVISIENNFAGILTLNSQIESFATLGKSDVELVVGREVENLVVREKVAVRNFEVTISSISDLDSQLVDIVNNNRDKNMSDQFILGHSI